MPGTNPATDSARDRSARTLSRTSCRERGTANEASTATSTAIRISQGLMLVDAGGRDCPGEPEPDNEPGRGPAPGGEAGRGDCHRFEAVGDAPVESL